MKKWNAYGHFPARLLTRTWAQAKLQISLIAFQSFKKSCGREEAVNGKSWSCQKEPSHPLVYPANSERFPAWSQLGTPRPNVRIQEANSLPHCSLAGGFVWQHLAWVESPSTSQQCWEQHAGWTNLSPTAADPTENSIMLFKMYLEQKFLANWAERKLSRPGCNQSPFISEPNPQDNQSEEYSGWCRQWCLINQHNHHRSGPPAACPTAPWGASKEETKSQSKPKLTSQIQVMGDSPMGLGGSSKGRWRGAGPSLAQRVPKAACPLLFKEVWHPSMSALREGAGNISEGGLSFASIYPCTSLPGGDWTLPFARPSPLATTAPLSITESLSVWWSSVSRRSRFTQVSLHLEEFSFKKLYPQRFVKHCVPIRGWVQRDGEPWVQPYHFSEEKTQGVKICCNEELNVQHLPDVWYYTGNVKAITFETLKGEIIKVL